MARFSQESIERVKDAVDIVEVVSAYTELRRSGQRFVGLCPFHDERTPSFSVNAAEKVYHCFGCGVGGDVITFVEEKEGLQFADAVEALAERYGVEVEREEEDPRVEEARKRRARLVELLDRTAGVLCDVSVGIGGGGQGARVPGRAGIAGGDAARVRRGVCAEQVGHGLPAGAAGGVLRSRSWWRRGS